MSSQAPRPGWQVAVFLYLCMKKSRHAFSFFIRALAPPRVLHPHLLTAFSKGFTLKRHHIEIGVSIHESKGGWRQTLCSQLSASLQMAWTGKMFFLVGCPRKCTASSSMFWPGPYHFSQGKRVWMNSDTETVCRITHLGFQSLPISWKTETVKGTVLDWKGLMGHGHQMQCVLLHWILAPKQNSKQLSRALRAFGERVVMFLYQCKVPEWQ